MLMLSVRVNVYLRQSEVLKVEWVSIRQTVEGIVTHQADNDARFCHRRPSHARTVVRECCKGDDESQLERGKFDLPPPKNPLTDGHQNLCR